MTKIATVTAPFLGCADGEQIVRQYQPGDTVSGTLAEAVVAEAWATFDASAESGDVDADAGAEKPAKKPKN